MVKIFRKEQRTGLLARARVQSTTLVVLAVVNTKVLYMYHPHSHPKFPDCYFLLRTRLFPYYFEKAGSLNTGALYPLS